MCFPVWRELKHCIEAITISQWASCNVLSRLKGIETLSVFCMSHIGLSCNVLSRLKGIETISKLSIALLSPTCNVLSRLKGIETNPSVSISTKSSASLRCAFPFEGNRNFMLSLCIYNGLGRSLAMCFPVWRELKLFYVFPFTFSC